MVGILGNSAIMAQIAGRGGNRAHLLSFISSTDDPFIKSLSCNGTITIESIKDGEPVLVQYSHLDNAEVNIQADADSEVIIKGTVKKLYFTAYDEDEEDYVGFTDLSALNISQCLCLEELSIDYNSALVTDGGELSFEITQNKYLKTLICGDIEDLTALDLSANTALQTLYCGGTGITALDLSANTALQTLNCNSCTGITALDLSANTALQYLYCNSCTGITALDLSANTALQYLYCNSCTGIISIKYPATNSNVSTKIAGAITAATAADGTVYTDSQGAYYSTIADAATAKGWTIEQLS